MEIAAKVEASSDRMYDDRVLEARMLGGSVNQSVNQKVFVAVFAGLCCLFGIAFVLFFGVDSVYWDEWENVALIQKAFTAPFPWNEILMQHNEHRIFFPNLVMLGFTSVFGYSSVVQMVLSQVFLASAFTVIAYVFSRQLVQQGWRFAWLFLPIVALFYSVRQTENFFWGFQTAFLMADASVIGVAYFISRWALDRAKENTSAVGVAVLGLVASFSSAMGLLSWGFLVLLGIVFWIRREPPRLAFWLCVVVAVVAAVLYMLGYTKPSHHPSLLTFLSKPIAFATYFLTAVGASFTSDRGIAKYIGLIIVLLTAATVFFVFRMRAYEKQLFWICLLGFAYATLLITSVGRAGFGNEQATSSRYSTFSGLIPIALFAMASTMIYERKTVGTVLYSLLLGSFLVFVIPTTWSGLKSAKRLKEARQYALFVTHNAMSAPDELVEHQLYPKADFVRNLVPFLQAEKDRVFRSLFHSVPVLPSLRLTEGAPHAKFDVDSIEYNEGANGIHITGASLEDVGHRGVSAVFLRVNDALIPAFTAPRQTGFEAYLPLERLTRPENTVELLAVSGNGYWLLPEKIVISRGDLGLVFTDSAGGTRELL